MAAAVVVLALILIPVASIMLALLLPAMSRARHHAQQTESSVSAHTNSLPSATAQTLSFGPVIERVVNLESPGKDSAIDFHTGNFVSLASISIPEGMTNLNEFKPQLTENFLAESGVDAIGQLQFFDKPTASAKPPKIVPLNGLVCAKGTEAEAVSTANWDEATADWVSARASQIRHTWKSQTMSGTGDLPKTYLFKTHEGGTGILQITGFTENPRGVKIRYKLVQTTAGG